MIHDAWKCHDCGAIHSLTDKSVFRNRGGYLRRVCLDCLDKLQARKASKPDDAKPGLPDL